MIVLRYFLWFLIYSAVGWAYETALCSAQERKFVNRGFLNGPLCPVYGFGAVALIFCLRGIENIPALFVAGAVLTCTVEYITSYVLERSFGARWWDYSHMRFHLHGRICLLGAVVFGAFSVVLLRWLHPVVSGLTDRLSDMAVLLLSAALFAGVAFDTYMTVSHLINLNSRLREIQQALNEFIEQSKKQRAELKLALQEGIERGMERSFEKSRAFSERVSELLGRRSIQDKRLMRAFPRLRSLRYNDALQKVRERLFERDKRK